MTLESQWRRTCRARTSSWRSLTGEPIGACVPAEGGSCSCGGKSRNALSAYGVVRQRSGKPGPMGDQSSSFLGWDPTAQAWTLRTLNAAET